MGSSTQKGGISPFGLYFLHGPRSESPCLWPHTTASGEKVRQSRGGLAVDFEAGRPSSDREFIILMNASTGLPILSADIKSIYVIVRPWDHSSMGNNSSFIITSGATLPDFPVCERADKSQCTFVSFYSKCRMDS